MRGGHLKDYWRAARANLARMDASNWANWGLHMNPVAGLIVAVAIATLITKPWKGK